MGSAFVVTSPYRMARVTSFLNPEADPLGKGHQALQSLVAVGNDPYPHSSLRTPTLVFEKAQIAGT